MKELESNILAALIIIMVIFFIILLVWILMGNVNFGKRSKYKPPPTPPVGYAEDLNQYYFLKQNKKHGTNINVANKRTTSINNKGNSNPET